MALASASMLRRLQGLQNMVRCAARARTGGIALGSGVAPKLHCDIAAQRLAPPLAEPNELFHLGFSRPILQRREALLRDERGARTARSSLAGAVAFDVFGCPEPIGACPLGGRPWR